MLDIINRIYYTLCIVVKHMPKLTFVDLFAGIGGMRIPFDDAGAKCVFSSEIDKYSRQTYFSNFGENPKGDIKKIDAAEIPNFDILIGGFPCQPFSLAGVPKYKSLGYDHGFNNVDKGTLFFDISRIINHHKPKAFLLENVKNLKSHDKGNTFNIIIQTLENLGYVVHYKIIDAAVVVPQHRERIFLVGFRSDLNINFKFPEFNDSNQKTLEDILLRKVDKKYTISDNLWTYLKKRKIEQQFQNEIHIFLKQTNFLKMDKLKTRH